MHSRVVLTGLRIETWSQTKRYIIGWLRSRLLEMKISWVKRASSQNDTAGSRLFQDLSWLLAGSFSQGYFQKFMENHKPVYSNTIILDIAGVFLSISSSDIEVLDFLSPLYQLFLLNDAPFTFNLEIKIRKDDPSMLYREEKHPQVGYREENFFLQFQAGEMIFNFFQCSGVLVTSMTNLAFKLEYCLRILFAYFILRIGGILIHAAGISRNGKGFIFSGPSGIGKSTVSKLSPEAIILNDDLTIIKPGLDQKWAIYSTPFANPGQKIHNKSVPLVGIYLLEQSNEVTLEEVSPGKAVAELFANVPVVSMDSHSADQLFTIIHEIIRDVPVNKLRFIMDPSFWILIDKYRG